MAPVAPPHTLMKNVKWRKEHRCKRGDVFTEACNLEPGTPGQDDTAILEKLHGFEKLGWCRKDKLTKKGVAISTALGLPIGACKYSWQLPENTKGEITATRSESRYDNSQGMETMAAEDAFNLTNPCMPSFSTISWFLNAARPPIQTGGWGSFSTRAFRGPLWGTGRGRHSKNPATYKNHGAQHPKHVWGRCKFTFENLGMHRCEL
jgi:hypothetical protein